MWNRRTAADGLLAAAVLIHLAVAIVHGRAHEGANVPLSRTSTAFVFIVIVAGPLIGLGLTAWQRTLGAWVIAITLAGSLTFGAVNHFLLGGPDHVAEVAAAWRGTFTTTAVLLAVTEAFGAVLAVRCAFAGRRAS